jgi:predicted Zn-dependent protease
MNESDLLPREECRRIFESVERAARSRGVDQVEAAVGAAGNALTRFANSTIHQNVAERKGLLSVRLILDHRTARASTNRLDQASIDAVVEQAVAITRAAEPDPELLPLEEPSDLVDVDRYCPSTAQMTPDDRAGAVLDAIRTVEEASQTAAGIFATNQSVEAILNSRGLFRYYFDTLTQFSITALGGDSSGWAKASAPDCDLVAPLELTRRAREKATLSSNPNELAPGRYTVILEPSAVQDLLGQMFYDFSATAMRDQRSFLTARLGKRIFSPEINIADDVYHPLQAGPPFDGEGVPRRRLTLVQAGVPTELAYSRQAARREGAHPTGHGFPMPNEFGEAPVNIVMEGAGTTLEQMIASTERGILVTRLWYIREVDPYEKIMTGMTRDGTFLVEGGRIVCGLKNFRFNQSLIELLNNVEALSPAERASGEEAFDMVVPAMKVRDFHFSEVTRF